MDVKYFKILLLHSKVYLFSNPTENWQVFGKNEISI